MKGLSKEKMELKEEKEQLQKEVEALEEEAKCLIESKQLESILKSKKEIKKEYTTAKKEYVRKKKKIYIQRDVLECFDIKNFFLSSVILSIVLTSTITLVQYDMNKQEHDRIYNYTSYYNDGANETVDEKETTHYEELKHDIDFVKEEETYDEAIITLKSPFEEKNGKYERMVSTYKLDCSENNITEETLKEYIDKGFSYTKEKLAFSTDIVTYEYRNEIDDEKNKEEVIVDANILKGVTNKSESDNPKSLKMKHPVLNAILVGSGSSLLGYSVSLLVKRKQIQKQIEKISKYKYDFDEKKEKEKIKKLKRQYKKKK